MARFNEILVARYNRYLQKLLGFKGGPPAAQLASEITPVFPVHRAGQVENYYLEGWNRFAFTRVEVGVGGITSVIRLRNSITSNMVAVFERINFFQNIVGAAPVLRLAATAVDLPTVFVVGNKSMDPRGATPPQRVDSALITSENSGAGGVLLQARLSGNVGPLTFFDFVLPEQGELALLPGDAIEVDGNGVGAGCTISWLWRERALEDSERA